MTKKDLSPEQKEFQEYAHRWLKENAPPPPPERLPITPIEVMTTGQRDYLQAWQKKCYEAGLVGADYPREYGGHGHECQDPGRLSSGRCRQGLGGRDDDAASDAAAFVSDRSVQLHGGIGFTWEYGLHIFFKRNLHNQAFLGDGVHQRKKLADLLMGPVNASANVNG